LFIVHALHGAGCSLFTGMLIYPEHAT